MGSKGIDVFQEATAQAEAAVKNLKDPELRRIAFEKILSELLQMQKGAASIIRQENTQTRKAKPRSSGPSREKSNSSGGSGVTHYINELVTEGYFKKQRTIADVKAELSNRGHHIPITSLSGPLQKLCQKRSLRRQKTKKNGEKETFSYSNW